MSHLSYSLAVWLNRTGIRALPVAPGRDFSNFTNVAILSYEGAKVQYPTNDSNVGVPVGQIPLVETNLHVSSSFHLR